jgi:hypothetical protein
MGGRLTTPSRPTVGSRHLRWENFEPRILKGPPSIEPVAGAPRVQIFIEPGGRRIGARFFAKKGVSVPSPLEEVALREVVIGGDNALEISTGNPDLYKDLYALCCSIADRVQVAKEPVSVAVRKALDSLAALIRRKVLLDPQVQIGLLGELLFLQRAARSHGWLAAANAWYGPDSEEHDFVLPRGDIEVKTTTREERLHSISSITQLLPKEKRPLIFVSIQLTPGPEGRQSFSLADQVASVMAGASRAAPQAADTIRDQLRRRGWLDAEAPHYSKCYQRRTPMLAAPVDRTFPAIVRSALASLGASASRIHDVSYSIDVNGLGALDGTPAFERLVFRKNSR